MIVAIELEAANEANTTTGKHAALHNWWFI